jgi:hypothetical protein
MPRRSTGFSRYLRETAMNVSRNVQDQFGTTEAAFVTQPDPTPSREGGGRASNHASAEARRSGKGDRLPPRERRGRD